MWGGHIQQLTAMMSKALCLSWLSDVKYVKFIHRSLRSKASCLSWLVT